jgi:Zn-dependent M28 family amino/carboxypeptidase
MVATMLEILRKMSQSPQTHKHGVVFLFNGFEENNLQGSYAFISGHEWFKKVRAVINMEATSTMGQVLMFQSGPNYPFLIEVTR